MFFKTYSAEMEDMFGVPLRGIRATKKFPGRTGYTFWERIRLLESGEALLRLRKEYERLPEEKTREIHQLKAKLEESIRQSARNRENWFQVYEDMEKKTKKAI